MIAVGRVLRLSPREATMQIVLRHLTGRRVGEVEKFPLGNYRDVVLGRAGAAMVCLDPDRRDEVSRWHARIIPVLGEPMRFLLVDLDPRQGTFVNGLRIPEAVPLRSGDVIRLGQPGPEAEFRTEPGV
jgi:serine protease Do